MSRIGRKPIVIPAGVEVKVDAAEHTITVKGPKGTLHSKFHPLMTVAVEGNEILVTRPNDEKEARSLHGLTRTLIHNMVVGVTEGFRKDLEIQGVGYRAAKQGSKLTLTLGFSHPVEFEDTDTIIMVNKADKNVARLRRHRRVRGKISGTAARPRLDVFRSAKHIYAQVIDDEQGVTLASASSMDKDFNAYGGNIDAAKKVGENIAKKCLEKGITEVVYDRGGFVYHGRVQALAEGAREAGLKL